MHYDIITQALMEVVEEQVLKNAVLLQAWCISSLEVCGSQMPLVVPRGLMFLLEGGKGTEGGRYFVSIWQCRVAVLDVIQ